MFGSELLSREKLEVIGKVIFLHKAASSAFSRDVVIDESGILFLRNTVKMGALSGLLDKKISRILSHQNSIRRMVYRLGRDAVHLLTPPIHE